LVAEYVTSGLQQKEFCAKHDVSVNTLQYWLYKRARRSGSKSGLESNSESGSTTKFLPVEVLPSPALKARADEERDHAVLVELPGGARLHFARGTPVGFITELVTALR